MGAGRARVLLDVVLSYAPHEGELWGGFVYSMLLSHLLLWPLAYGLKQLPLRDVI